MLPGIALHERRGVTARSIITAGWRPLMPSSRVDCRLISTILHLKKLCAATHPERPAGAVSVHLRTEFFVIHIIAFNRESRVSTADGRATLAGVSHYGIASEVAEQSCYYVLEYLKHYLNCLLIHGSTWLTEVYNRAIVNCPLRELVSGLLVVRQRPAL